MLEINLHGQYKECIVPNFSVTMRKKIRRLGSLRIRQVSRYVRIPLMAGSTLRIILTDEALPAGTYLRH